MYFILFYVSYKWSGSKRTFKTVSTPQMSNRKPPEKETSVATSTLRLRFDSILHTPHTQTYKQTNKQKTGVNRTYLIFKIQPQGVSITTDKGPQ